jgi:hypothetical protein
MAAADESANLLAGGRTDAGYCSEDPNAATTIPGWTIISGSPTIVCSALGAAFGSGAAVGLIAGGPYGDSTLRQVVDVSAAAADIALGKVHMTVSAWLGGRAGDRAQPAVTATFLDADGETLGDPVWLSEANTDRGRNRTILLLEKAESLVPPETRAIEVILQFVDTHGGPASGLADDLRLTLSVPLEPKPLAPPPSTVPALDHVFLVMMANTDYAQVIGDTENAPYINGLLARGTLLTRYNDVYHPGNLNALAIAAGATPVKPGLYFPDVALRSRSLADEIEARHLSWRSYQQGMGSPCNLTDKRDRHFHPDDAPFVDFVAIVSDAPRCQAHIVDTAELNHDLASASTTPNLAWITPDSYYNGDVSGDGAPHSVRVQDGWVKATLGPIFNAPAWTKQRSLLVLTWSQSASTETNHVATILVGSQGLVRTNAVSTVAYDPYSLARTIEAGLGLAPVGVNDAYARPMNDVFVASQNPDR